MSVNSIEPIDDRIVNNYSDGRPPTKVESAIVVTMVLGAVGAFVAFIRYDIKRQKEAEEERKAQEDARQKEKDDFDDWLKEQRAMGNVVIQARVGDRISIPAEAYKNAIIRRSPGMRF